MTLRDVAGPELIVSLAGVLLVALVAARLLGVKRPLSANLVSGLVGWLAGLALSLVIAHSQPNPDAGFARNLWIFSIVFTMGTTVFAEMLARPGALARAQAGIARIPHPIRALRARAHRTSRYAQIVQILLRHGLGPALGLARSAPGDDDAAPSAVRLRRALEDAGGIFVKLGQVLSTRSDLLPAAICAELARLQDEVSPADPAAMRAVLEAELGPVEQHFAAFDWEPLGTASIGQAYRARLRSGVPVVVKIQRPRIGEQLARDTDVMRALCGLAAERTAWGREYRVDELANEFIERLEGELDFRAEARSAIEIAAGLDPALPVRAPSVHEQLSGPRVLVMEWFDGNSVQHLTELAPDRRLALADALLGAMLRQVLAQGCFHADPHPGNILVLHDATIGLIDFGAAGRLNPLQQSALRDLLVGLAQRDPAQLRDAVLQVAEPRRDVDETTLERAVARFVARHLGPGAQPSAQMLGELLGLCFTFGLTLPPELSTAFRALASLEGTLRVLSPGYSAIAAQRLAADWARDHAALTSLPDLVRDELVRVIPVLRRLPHHVNRIATLTERGRLQARIALFATTAEQQFLTKLVNRVVLAFLGGAVGLLSAVLLVSTSGPAFTGTTSLFQFFGYFDLFCASVLILRVLVAVLVDRLN